MTWQPLFLGSARDEIAAVVRELGTAVLAIPRATDSTARVPGLVEDGRTYDLADGSAGVAAFLVVLGNALRSRDLKNRACELLQAGLTSINGSPLGGLHYGLAGVGWALALIQREQTSAVDEETLIEIDQVLLDLVERDRTNGMFDLTSGYAGVLAYALERLPSSTGRRLAIVTAAALHACSGAMAGVGAWRTTKAWVRPNFLAVAPEGYFDLGVAYGNAGACAALAKAVRADVAPAGARARVEAVARWILEQRVDTPLAAFPWWTEGAIQYCGFHAWCYGDPGVAAALFTAADAVGDSVCMAEAVSAVQQAAARSIREHLIQDATLQHGAAGVAHIYNRFYQRTGDRFLRDAAASWIRETLRWRQPGSGIGGYRGIRFEGTATTERWKNARGFLTGAAGVGLVLLGAIGDDEPVWDSVLMLA